MGNSKQLFVTDKYGQRGIIDVTAPPPFDGSGTEILVSLSDDARRVAVPINALVDRKEQGYFLPLGFEELSMRSNPIDFQNTGTVDPPVTGEAPLFQQSEIADERINTGKMAYDRDETLSQLRPTLVSNKGAAESHNRESYWQDDTTIEMTLPLLAEKIAAARTATEKAARDASPIAAFARPQLVIDTGAKHQNSAAGNRRSKSPLFLYASLAVALTLGVLGGLLLSGFSKQTDAPDMRADGSVSTAQSLSTAILAQSKAPFDPASSNSLLNKAAGGTIEPGRNNEVRGRTSVWRNPSKDNPANAELRSTLDEWIAAIQTRDIDKLLGFYSPAMQAYYGNHNVSLDAVRADKIRRMESYSLIDNNVDEPEITFTSDGRAALMLFHLQYVNRNAGDNRREQVWHELKWLKITDGWKIVCEREVSAARR